MGLNLRMMVCTLVVPVINTGLGAYIIIRQQCLLTRTAARRQVIVRASILFPSLHRIVGKPPTCLIRACRLPSSM